MAERNIRLLLPQWQGGVDPNYVIGSQIMDAIIPPMSEEEIIQIPVDLDVEKARQKKNGFEAFDALFAQVRLTKKVLQLKQPDRLLTIGGDCSTSEAPFDYLSGRYGDDFGILWLDAHPDISDPTTSSHLHEMPAYHLLGKGEDPFARQIEHPVKAEKIMFAGLRLDQLRPMDHRVKDLQMKVATPQQLASDSQLIQDWLTKEKISHVAVHFDVDVLSPHDYRSILPAEPYTNPANFPAAVGQLTLKQVGRVLKDLEEMADLVGLTIAENMPWDAINLRKEISQLKFFK